MMQACRIPLFQVPGITDTRGPPKSVSLVETPESKRAWYASKSSRLRLPDLQPRLRLLYHDQSYSAPIVVRSAAHRHVTSPKPTQAKQPTQNKTKYPILNSPKQLISPPPSLLPQSKPTDADAGKHSNRGNDFMGFPKQNVVPKPVKPLLIGPEDDSARPYVRNLHYQSHLSYPLQNGPSLKLINPREVLAYENKKRASTNQGYFQSVKWKGPPPSSKPIPPLPVMKVQAPLFEESKMPVHPRDVRLSPTTEDSRPKSPQKRVTFSEPNLKDSTTSPRRSDQEEFHGLLSQTEIKHEFETAAAMHYLALVMKNQASDKPRTKEMGQQTDEVSAEDVIIENPPPKSKHLPPPDIYLKLRFAKDAGLPLENVASELKQGKDFVNVADVDSKSVLEGITADDESSPISEQNEEKESIQTKQQPQEWLSVNSIIAEHLKEVTKASSVKRSNKNNWSSAMQQMSSQLDVIDEMAQNMQRDIRDTERLVQTIDTLTDVMAPPVGERMSTHIKVPQKSDFEERNLSPLLEVSYESSPRLPRSKRIQPISSSYITSPRHHAPQQKVSYASQPPHQKSLSTESTNFRKYDQYRNRMNNALQLAHESISGEIGNFDDDYGKRISEEAESSIRSSVISLEQELSMISQQRHQSPVSSKHDFQDSYQHDLQDELTQLNESINAPKARVKHWKDRTQDEKASIRRWMAKKRKERTEKYKVELQRRREKEKRPFQSKQNNMNSTLTKQETSERRLADVDTRLEEAMLLLKDLKSDHPHLPTEIHGTGRSIGRKRHGSTSPGKHYRPYMGRKIGYQPLTPSRKHMTSTSVKSGSSVSYSAQNRKPPIGTWKSDNFSKNPISASDSFSDISGVSGWTMSDEVKALLYSTDSSRKPYKEVTFDLGQRSKTGTAFDDFMPDNSVNLTDLGIRMDETIEDRVSQNTESLIGDVDWLDVERMVASVNIKDKYK